MTIAIPYSLFRVRATTVPVHLVLYPAVYGLIKLIF
jgi:hypothetical protein